MARRPSTINPMKSVIARRLLLLLGGLLIGLLAAGQIANAAPGADWSRIAVTNFEGDALSQPVAYGAEGTAGPWKLTLLEVHTGDDATKLVTDASGTNAPPPDGMTYVVLKLRAQNTGTTPLEIGNDDFGVASSSGVIRRFQEVVPPDPALAATVAPGASMDGWVVGAAATDDTNLVLVYDSTTISGNYADATLALENGATLAPAGNRAVKLNKIGRSPDDPAGLETQLATRNWVVQLDEVVTGADVVGLFPDSDVRTTALLGTNPNASDTWVAFHVTITNNQTGDQPAFLPPTAFTLADGDGNPVPDLSTLSPPIPTPPATTPPAPVATAGSCSMRLVTMGRCCGFFLTGPMTTRGSLPTMAVWHHRRPVSRRFPARLRRAPRSSRMRMACGSEKQPRRMPTSSRSSHKEPS